MARILVVDDDHSILALERLILTEAGHDVLMAHEANTALELLRTYDVDLVIVDVMMPELNGFQLVNMVKNNPKYKSLHVAFLTAKNEAKDVVRAAKLGADFYVTKPIVRDEFLEKITNFFKTHPPKIFAQIRFEVPPGGDAKICHSIQIAAISEVGIEVLTQEIFEVDQILELSASVLHEIPLKNPTLRVQYCRRLKNGRVLTSLRFVEPDRDVIKRVQRWISYRSLKP